MNKIALVGNPNCGKTTLFNALTGSKQHVGNWPGVTVEKKVGKLKSSNIEIVDLPGIYSLSPNSIEEILARDFIIHEKPKAIINLIDGTNLERNLYLTLQLMELEIPIILAVNMLDEIKEKKWELDFEKLSKVLGITVIPISAKTGENIKSLIEKINNFNLTFNNNIIYDNLTENAVNEISLLIDNKNYPLKFCCSKLLENDFDIIKKLNLTKQQIQKIDAIAKEHESHAKYGDRETMIADSRYKYIEKISKSVLDKSKEIDKNQTSKIDKIITNRFLALPIFLGVMFLMFWATFGPIGNAIKGSMDYLINTVIGGNLSEFLVSQQAPEWTKGLLIEGIIGGVGGVLSFTPQIAILFLFMSILEDSGYMARVAFIMDRMCKKIGLSGKSFIPMLMGFGCTTPAVMAARTMENEKDRKMTIMLTSFMSCGARLPIYGLFAEIFFEKNQALVVFSMYILGMLIAIISGLILKNTLFRGNVAPFIMELPQYRFPSTGTTLRHMWDKTKGFIIKAGTIIFAMSVVLWVLRTFNFSLQMVEEGKESMLGVIGSFIAPIFIPLGFGNWQSSVSILTGIVAKEAVVSTMAVVYGVGEAGANAQGLKDVITQGFTPLSAYSFMAFTLLYMPCLAAFATIKKEMGSWKWSLGTVLFLTGVAYFVSFLIYQIGSLII